jgi:hypothetical protein
MYRHKRTTCKYSITNATEKIKYLENKIEKIQISENIRLVEEVKYLKSLVGKAGNIAAQNSETAAKSMSALSFIMKNYPNAPAIENIKQLDYTKIKSGDNDLATTIAAYYEDNMLSKYLSGYIVTYYKTDDLSKRSFWGSDVSRCTFITRTLSENNQGAWVYDMKGKCVGKSIIEPMLEHIKQELLKYIDDVPAKLKKITVAEGFKITAIQRSSYKAIDIINSGFLKEEIIREISPYFYLNKTSPNLNEGKDTKKDIVDDNINQILALK